MEGFLHWQSTALTVLSVDPKVDGYGDEILLIRFTCDDGNDAKGLPDSPERLELMDRLCTELQDADIEASPVVSFTAESEVGKEPVQRTPERLLQIAADLAEANAEGCPVRKKCDAPAPVCSKGT